LRRSFLENVIVNREIVDAYRRGRLPAPPTEETVRLPNAYAPTGRPLHDDEYANVTWTLSAPEDESVRGKPARRQARLRRLLQEAADQGAAPTVDDLAGALGVSRSTIKRDLAALRQAGFHVQTRGSRK
jgi:biotin operon repressor